MNKPSLNRRDWLKTAMIGGSAALLPTALRGEPNPPPARKVRGVIYMVSDGMSPGVLTLAEAWSQLSRKTGTRWWQLLNEPTTSRGLMDTASANSLVTDSAAASSSWGCGQRINNGSINISPNGQPLTPIAQILKKSSARIGLVSTATITHATPAGFAANESKRGDESNIAPQYLERVDVVLGGGGSFFDPQQREDKKDLYAQFASRGYGVVKHREALRMARDEKLLGIFADGHLPFSIDRAQSPELSATVPTLEEMANAALDRFLDSGKTFLLQIEGARIDHAAHLNDIGALLHDQIAFDDALQSILTRTAGRADILVVVTSDHGNSNPGLRGMGTRYTDTNDCFAKILQCKGSHERLFSDWNDLKSDDFSQLANLVRTRLGFELKSEETAALANALAKRPVMEWNEQLSKPEGLLGQFSGNHTGVGWTGTTHTTDPTLVSAVGPQADRFGGMLINKDVFGHLVEMLS